MGGLSTKMSRRAAPVVVGLVGGLSLLMLAGCFEDSTAASGFKLQRVFANVQFSRPVALVSVPNANNQWWVLEKEGRVVRVSEQQGQYTREQILDISERVNSEPSEAGLLGLAFHPRYQQNRRVFLSYTAAGPQLTSTISRFSVADDGTINSGSEQVLLQLEQPYGNHNGGQIEFGPDGFLYIGFGDGGSGGDPHNHGQNTATLLGNILRIDVDNGNPYAIPPGNPFAGSTESRPEIYAWGMRNPWRFSFDRSNGELWVADVGQNQWEEINLVLQTGNYGWNIKEGDHCYVTPNCEPAAAAANVIDPVAEYSHADGCSVTGGYVYRGEQVKSLQGTYLFGDFCSGRIWGLTPADAPQGSRRFRMSELLKSGLMISSFAQDNLGELYVLHYQGEIYKLVPTAN